MNQEERRKQTKRLLLDTTVRLVIEKGCSQMTLNDIMEHCGLSKGAIYHYVKSKNELLVWVLEESLEEVNRQFFAKVEEGKKEFSGPMQAIIENLPSLQDPENITNRIFIYLLGQNDQPAVREFIRRFYEQAVQKSKKWIAAGQQGGVIPMSVDADETAELFILITFGFRMRSIIENDPSFAFGLEQLSSFMVNTLILKRKGKEMGD